MAHPSRRSTLKAVAVAAVAVILTAVGDRIHQGSFLGDYDARGYGSGGYGRDKYGK